MGEGYGCGDPSIPESLAQVTVISDDPRLYLEVQRLAHRAHALLARAQRAEVLARIGRRVRPQLERDAPHREAPHGYIEEAAGKGGHIPCFLFFSPRSQRSVFARATGRDLRRRRGAVCAAAVLGCDGVWRARVCAAGRTIVEGIVHRVNLDSAAAQILGNDVFCMDLWQKQNDVFSHIFAPTDELGSF